MTARYRKLSPRIHPHGVFKFRSIEEAQAARQQVALASLSIASPSRAGYEFVSR
jgi:hypothetical protein